ncbi:Transcription factor [Aspergillus fumigatus]
MSSTDTSDPSTMSTTSTAANTASSSSAASTPSPSNSSVTTAPSTSTSRRPPRKSTLTQQQKNNKRQRATQDQLVTLELEFNKNPTPTAATRERIAQEINMTERSVQIWFQNRRAKIKMLAKKSIETGEGCDSIPESMRQYLAMQFDPSKAGARDPFGRTGAYGANGAYPSESAPSGKVGEFN